MITNIAFVDSVTLQNILDQEIGANIFYVGAYKDVTPKQCYLQYEDTTPEIQVNQALTISAEQATILLNDTMVRLYQSLEQCANRQVTLVAKPVFSQNEVQQAQAWLNDQTLPVPACVSFVALSNSISNQDAATKIINSQADYDALIQQIMTLKEQGQTAVMNSTDAYSAKTTGYDYMQQIKNILGDPQ